MKSNSQQISEWLTQMMERMLKKNRTGEIMQEVPYMHFKEVENVSVRWSKWHMIFFNSIPRLDVVQQFVR